MPRTILLCALALAAALLPRPARGQDAWNSPRALELVTRAQERRALTQTDTGMVDYQADARGWIYFYLDRRDVEERTLVKTDQVALDVFWKAPAFSKQRIIGLRDEKSLPTNIRYHEDHLTVVQDNFGDLIRLGDGDEVRDVLHPAAAGGPGFYDYRLSDSLSIRLPGADEPVKVYELDVRPKDESRPAFVGAIFVDQRRGDIVKMSFTFTRVSYVDRQLDYINVSLENGLWKGRFWLPHRQQLELRRQLPELGFPAGGVIRGTMQVSNYRFNQNLPASIFAGRRVVSVPEAQRRAFAFEEPIDAELRQEGISPEVELAEVRRQAAELVRARMLSGLPATRADVAAASSILRYNRAESLAGTLGFRSEPREGTSFSLRGGWAFGPMHPIASAEVVREWPGGTRVAITAQVNTPRDVGVGPAVSGAVNSLTALLAGRDYTDPFYASGLEMRATRPAGTGWTAALRLYGEDQRSAERETTFSFAGAEWFRPVRPVDEGIMVGGGLALVRRVPAEKAAGWSATVGLDAGWLVDADGGEIIIDAVGEEMRFVRPRADFGWVRRFAARSASLEVDASAGAAFGELPRQALYLIGGRGTVPGHDFRAYGGDRFALLRATLSADVVPVFLRGRLTGAAGWSDVGGAGEDALARWGARTAEEPIFSVGAGVGIFYDILRIDLARGVGPGGAWELIVEANPSFWDFL